MRTSRLKSSFLYSITLVSFFFCCFVRERERMKREIHSRQQNQNVAYIILEKTRTRFHASVRLAFAGYRRERNVRSFPAASRGSRREGRVVDRFSSFFSRCRDFFICFYSSPPSLSFFLSPPIPRPRKKKEIIVLERRRTPRDRRIARVPRDSSAPNIYYRAERITKTGGGRKRRRKRRRRTLFFLFTFMCR